MGGQEHNFILHVDYGVTAEYFGLIPRNDIDASIGISLTVPPAGDKPTVPWQRAVAECFAGAGNCDRFQGPVRVSLAVGYDPNSDQEEPGRSIESTMNHDLVYVLAQTSGPCTGSAGRSHPSCRTLNFIDAHTGAAVGVDVSGPSITDPSK